VEKSYGSILNLGTTWGATWPVSVQTALNWAGVTQLVQCVGYGLDHCWIVVWFPTGVRVFFYYLKRPSRFPHTFCAVGITVGLFPGKTAGLWGPTLKELHLLPETRSIVPIYWHFTAWHLGEIIRPTTAADAVVISRKQRPLVWIYREPMSSTNTPTTSQACNRVANTRAADKRTAFVKMVMNIWAP